MGPCARSNAACSDADSETGSLELAPLQPLTGLLLRVRFEILSSNFAQYARRPITTRDYCPDSVARRTQVNINHFVTTCFVSATARIGASQA
jgi:hypothetical protein